MIRELSLLPLAMLLAASTAWGAETKDIQYKFKNAGPVVFSHDLHLQKYNDKCKVCHDAIFSLKARKRFTMAEMEKGKSCGACHTGIKAFSVATEKDCIRCHSGKPKSVQYKVKGAGDVTFSHDVHIKATGGKCKGCHNGTVITGKDKNVTMAQMEKGKTCGACHNDKKAFTVAGNCGKCHSGMKPKDITFKLKNVAPAQFSHSVHLGMFKCQDCHTKLFPYKAGAKHYTMAEIDKGKSCGACHNGKDAFASTADCAKCHKGYVPPPIVFKNDGGEVKFNHKYHMNMYKCADCHTKVFPYKAGAKHFDMAQMEAGNSCGKCHNGNDAFSVKGDCEKCHKM